MTAGDLSKVIGASGTFSLALNGGDLKVPVKIIDAKSAYGNTRYKVQPIGGSGAAWVDATRVQTKGAK